MSCSLLLIPVKCPPLTFCHPCSSRESISHSWLTNYTRSDYNYKFKSRRNGYLTGRLCCKSQLADISPAAYAAYGVLLLGGGLFAFSKSGSKGSLFGGLTGATLMATAYILMQGQETKAAGDALAFGSAFLFSSVFGIRLAATRKLIPSGALLVLSICALVVFISAYVQDGA